MTALYIILGIVLFFALILSLNISVSYKVENKEFSAILGIGPLRFRILPSKKKKFNYKKLAKRLKGKKISKITFTKKEKPKNEKQSLDIKEILSDLRLDSIIGELAKSTKNPELTKLLLTTLKEFAIRFRKKLYIKFKHIHIVVDEGDAGDTCIRVGVLWQALTYLLEFLNVFTNMSPINEGNVSITPAFDSSGYVFRSEGSFRVRVSGVLSSLIASLFKSIVNSEKNITLDTTRKDTQK